MSVGVLTLVQTRRYEFAGFLGESHGLAIGDTQNTLFRLNRHGHQLLLLCAVLQSKRIGQQRNSSSPPSSLITACLWTEYAFPERSRGRGPPAPASGPGKADTQSRCGRSVARAPGETNNQRVPQDGKRRPRKAYGGEVVGVKRPERSMCGPGESTASAATRPKNQSVNICLV